MNHITIEKYIEIFEKKVEIVLLPQNIGYQVEKENSQPILFFDRTEAVFKVSDGKKFYAVKCFSNNFDVKNGIYDDEVLKTNNAEDTFVQESEINIKDSANEIDNIKVLFAPWIDDDIFKNCDTRYAKQLHHGVANIAYNTFRKKIKFGVVTTILASIMLILSLKYMYPNEIYINPIDYKKLIAADSLKTINIALNRNKILLDGNALKKSDEAEKSIFIKENGNEVLSILVPEVVKVNKPVLKKIKEIKKVPIPPTSKNKATTKQTKKVDEQEIKVIHSKSKVTFKKTEF